MSLSTGVLGLVGLGLGAASTAADSYAAYQQARAENLAARWNAGLMENNAALADLRAGQALEKGEHDVALARIGGGRLIESQRGAYAASGVRIDSGSALDVVAQQAGMNKYDEDMLAYNAGLNAWGIRAEADSLRRQAAMTRATQRSPALAAASSLLGGGTSMFNQYRR